MTTPLLIKNDTLNDLHVFLEPLEKSNETAVK